jgi:hypothetical protein
MIRARAFVACLLLFACIGATRPSLTLEVQVNRSSFDLLDPIAVTVAVWNHTKTQTGLHFPSTVEYEVEVLSGTTTISTTLASPAPGGIAHTRAFLPGVTPLAVYELNVEGADHSVPAPGIYTLRVSLLDDGRTTPVEKQLRFIAPLSVSALSGIGTHVVTISGTLGPDRMTIADASGSVALTHRILNEPAGTSLALRGAMIKTPSRVMAFNPVVWGVLTPPQ